MKKLTFYLLTITALTSCTTNTGTGIITGGTLGAGIGSGSGGGLGALIGSTAGLIAGGLTGAILDQQDRKVIEQSSPRTMDRMDRGDPLTLNDIIKLSQGGISDEAIIDYIRQSKSFYQLTQTQVRRLRNAGVSERIIRFIGEAFYRETT